MRGASASKTCPRDGDIYRAWYGGKGAHEAWKGEQISGLRTQVKQGPAGAELLGAGPAA